MAVNRELLKQALAEGQQITNVAVSGQGFDPRGGWGVAAAQIAAAGIGAFAQNRARKQLAELELGEQQAFATQFPQFAGLAGGTTPETRQAVMQQILAQKLQPKVSPAPLTDEAKREADIRAGFIGRDAPIPKDPKKAEVDFKSTRDLREEFTKNSGEFIKQKDAFDRIQASLEEPSAAGDLALIFNYMKLLDPGSTVREGEFATAQNSAGVPEIIRAKFNQVSKGERLADNQRADFANRSTKLYSKALKSQDRRIGQFKGIAERNQLPVEDVIIDLVGDRPEAVKSVQIVNQEKAKQTPISKKGFEGFKILSVED